MSPLERRCRLLLRAYPPDYREDRGEEIVDTLLQATPDGRTWPLPRDVRAIVAGGLRARTALHRERTTSANLRAAAIVGVSAYLSTTTAWYLKRASAAARAGVSRHSLPPHIWEYAGPIWLAPALIALTVILACTCRRRVLSATAAIPMAVVCLARYWPAKEFGDRATLLLCLALLVVLAGGEESPGGQWLLLFAAVTMPAALGRLSISTLLVLILAVASVVWIAIDARPAVATAAFLLLWWLAFTLDDSGLSPARIVDVLPVGAIAATIAAPAVWRLRRQSAT